MFSYHFVGHLTVDKIRTIRNTTFQNRLHSLEENHFFFVKQILPDKLLKTFLLVLQKRFFSETSYKFADAAGLRSPGASDISSKLHLFSILLSLFSVNDCLFYQISFSI